TVIDPRITSPLDISKAASQAASDTTDNFDFSQWIKSFRSALGLSPEEAENMMPGTGLIPFAPGLRNLAKGAKSREDLATLDSQSSELSEQQRSSTETGGWRLDYNHIVGYDQVMEQMKSFGFFRKGDEGLRRFADRVANLHGIGKLSLSQPFLFSGPDFNDVSFFAHATASEIGWPLLNIRVEVDERGNGTIKIAGPFRHRFFGGPPDLTELSTPCTVLLEDISALQQIFDAEQRSWSREGLGQPGPNSPGYGGPNPWEGGPPRRSVRIEFGAYLRELINKPGVFFMATCRDGFQPSEYLTGIVGQMREIQIENPIADERKAIWERLQHDHTSMQGLDISRLVELSDGVPRTMLFGVAHHSLDEAYRASLSSGQYRPVRLADILTNLSGSIEQSSESYQQLEDAAVAEFLRDLEEND
ncbi:MAG: hypothetical protein LBU61_04905, partial [Coriobacteriales bacterium]|nr:hypothetical protein [Coriobacteriales bacterium]